MKLPLMNAHSSQMLTRRTFLAGATAALVVGGNFLPLVPGALAPEASAQSQTVTVYSARHYDSDNVIYQRFQARTGIKVNVVSDSDATKLLERIRSEGSRTSADLFITADAGNLWRAENAGILQPVQSQVLNRAIPANLRDSQNHWFALSKRARVIMYNKDRVKPNQLGNLANYEDLAKPMWKGRVIMRSSQNVYNQSLVGSIIAAAGAGSAESWVRGLVANFKRPPQGNDTAQIQAVAAGQADVTVANTYYLVRLAKSNKSADRNIASKIGVVFPNQGGRGTHVNISGAGVVKGAKNRANAVRLLEFMVSKEAQEVFAKSNNEYPVIGGVTLDPILVRYGRFKEDPLNVDVIGRNNTNATKIMDRAGWR
ncbi:MAG: Fe(3+) ABC transporter substrate-binding protein [Pseudanabaenaceae cyanobacterium]